jgi:hypothetical protein
MKSPLGLTFLLRFVCSDFRALAPAGEDASRTFNLDGAPFAFGVQGQF